MGAVLCGCGGCGGVASGGGGGGGRVVSSLTKNLVFCSLLPLRPGVGEAIWQPTKPGLEYQQKTRQKPPYNQLILQGK
jgi:hypothetical protein